MLESLLTKLQAAAGLQLYEKRLWLSFFPGNLRNFREQLIYLFKVNNGNTRIMFEICLKLTIKTPERRQ